MTADVSAANPYPPIPNFSQLGPFRANRVAGLEKLFPANIPKLGARKVSTGKKGKTIWSWGLNLYLVLDPPSENVYTVGFGSPAGAAYLAKLAPKNKQLAWLVKHVVGKTRRQLHKAWGRSSVRTTGKLRMPSYKSSRAGQKAKKKSKKKSKKKKASSKVTWRSAEVMVTCADGADGICTGIKVSWSSARYAIERAIKNRATLAKLGRSYSAVPDDITVFRSLGTASRGPGGAKGFVKLLAKAFKYKAPPLSKTRPLDWWGGDHFRIVVEPRAQRVHDISFFSKSSVAAMAKHTRLPGLNILWDLAKKPVPLKTLKGLFSSHVVKGKGGKYPLQTLLRSGIKVELGCGERDRKRASDGCLRLIWEDAERLNAVWQQSTFT